MPVITASVRSPLPPAEVLTVLTDFGPTRAERWAGVDDDHLQVHEQGDGFADVTEGNAVGWERERYAWDAELGIVTATTIDSNLWAAGSRWHYALVPDGTGTRIDVVLERKGKGIKGTLIGLLLRLIGRRMITQSISGAVGAAPAS